MRINLVQIGNSQGIRLPKAILKQCGFQNSIEIEVKNGELILKSPIEARSGWAEAFSKTNNKNSNDFSELDSMQNNWDKKEWTW